MSREEVLIEQVRSLSYMIDELKGWNHATEVECATCLNTGERLTRDGFERYCHCAAGSSALDEDEYSETMRAEWV